MEIRHQQPNLFEFATKELAQDAFIAWLFSWIHQEKQVDQPAMQEAARSLLASFLNAAIPGNVSKDQVAKATVVEILPQQFAADLWIQFELPDRAPICLLIEDKTHTSFHSEQLDRAAKDGRDEAEKINAELIKIYFKTGWIRPDELQPPAGFTLVRRSEALEALTPYSRAHPVLTDFVYWLAAQEDQEREVRAGALDPARVAESFWYHAGLQSFLTSIFGEDFDPEESWFASGMGRGGVPWMHFGVYSVERPGDGFEECEYLFWRADLRSGKPTLSLRKYWKHSKSEADSQFARERMAQLVDAVERTLEDQKDIARKLTSQPRSAHSSAYFEQELLVYPLGEEDGENDPRTVAHSLPDLNRAIVKAFHALDP